MSDKPSIAHLTKIMGNFMLFSAIQSMAEAIAHVKAVGLDERIFLEAMTSTIFTAPIYKNYGTMMVENNFTMPGAVSMGLALKDVRLALQSSQTEKTVLPTALLLQSHLSEGITRGYGDHDVSSLSQLMKDIR
jgi:3-hydroxyisobutyrate dehydrogenase-like beta-hydroxyacid dehydrogenase